MRAPSVLAVAALAALPACRMQFGERVTGTAIGTGAGALVGGLLGSAVGGTAGGAVLGGIAGGAAGYVIGDWIQERRERREAQPCFEPAPGAAPHAAPDPETTYAGGGGARPPPVSPTSVSEARREYEAGRTSLTAEEAIAHYDTSIRLDPTRPEPHNARGLVHLYLGRRAEARASFQRALALDPAYEPASYNLRRLGGA